MIFILRYSKTLQNWHTKPKGSESHSVLLNILEQKSKYYSDFFTV